MLEEMNACAPISVRLKTTVKDKQQVEIHTGQIVSWLRNGSRDKSHSIS